LLRGRLRALPWMASNASGLPRSNLHQPGAPAATPPGCMVNPQAYALVAAVVGSSVASAERRGSRRGAWGNLSSLDGFGRRAGRAASTATATASAAPRVVLCVADGIVRIVVHVAAGEDLGRRLRRGIDRLIGVTAGEDKCCDHDRDAEPHGRFPTHWSRPVGRSFGRCAGEVGHHTLRRRGWRSH
jgi:hypothetical protein